jgi:glycine oxidase
MKKNYDVVVVGGGVNGCSIAYQLSKRGYKTAIVEKKMIGAESSSAAAGMLGAQVEFETNDAFFQFACKSRELFPELINELEDVTGMRAGYVENGMLKIACSDKEVEHLRNIEKTHKQAGQEVQWIEKQQLQHLESEISETAQGALFIQKDGQVKADQLTVALSRAALKKGADVYEFTEALSLIEDDARVTGVNLDRGKLYAEEVVIAAGAWSDRLVKDLPMIPVKGEILSVKPEKPLINRTLHATDFYIVPKAGGSVYIGATETEGAFDKHVRAASIQSLLAKAHALVPGLKKAAFEEAWSGVRPQTADGKPYIGKGEKDGLWFATGHFRNGILLSAITGEWMADLIEGLSPNKEWEAAFSPSRVRLKGGEKVEVNY